MSRQTISNWETGKSYLDLESLLLLSDYFDVSLDELVKGDVQMMKEKVNVVALNRGSQGMVFGVGIEMLAVALTQLVSYPVGVGVFLIGTVICIGFAIKVEKIKKELDIKTYGGDYCLC
ncbi:hypothetical protein Hs30E_20290 [Lactococcus hodotermopsidis]|uniref:HTH cro/C1-type domain-containing protein n=1 Tax=Pseudolactococcus hodotermopsidis TaxID=2709157 RepID=A0A6A0BGJ1_9LACT|nr:helix-turn-helix domain-containing protein [Lactococcus hodotermopsidis]GFH43478.1 hypothetical protein Hs30E_20290 [Lactococcus hodotermopsidis]